MITEQVTAPVTAEWVRSRLAKLHPAPSSHLDVRAHDWMAGEEPVREWLLATDPARCERIESEVQRWALRVGLYRPESASAMVQGPCTILAAAMLPDAPDELVRLLSRYWTLIIAFDDQVVEAGQPPEPYRREVGDILLRGELPARPDVFHLAFAEVRAGLLELGGEAVLPAFTHQVTDAIGTYVGEWRHGREGTSPSIGEYLRAAVANSHILPGMLLQRLLPGFLPAGVPLPADLGHLARLVTMLARLENDLLSYRKDERDGAANVCWVLAREYGIEPIQAVPIVAGMAGTLRVQLDDLLGTILADSARGGDHRQAAAMGDWADACYAWFLTVARYGFGKS